MSIVDEEVEELEPLYNAGINALYKHFEKQFGGFI